MLKNEYYFIENACKDIFIFGYFNVRFRRVLYILFI